MHLGNGAITTECALFTLAVAGAGVSFAGWQLSRSPLTSEARKLAIATAGMVFAAQAVNVSVGEMSSAHLVGGALLAMLVGPSAGVIAMSIILLLQALLLGDGGIASLGANIINMALIPALLVAVSERLFAANEESDTHRVIRGGAVALLSIIVAALLIPGEIWLARSASDLIGLSAFASQMLRTHLVVAIAEGTITAVVVALVAVPSRAHVHATSGIDVSSSWMKVAALPIVVAVLFIVASPWGSGLPDGYEHAAEATNMKQLLEESPKQLLTTGTLAASSAAMQENIATALAWITSREQLWLAVTTIASMLLMAAAISLLQLRTHSAQPAASI